ncbi:hypothetical protein [Acinetobacter sp. XS-4]|uniref:hypothetical protein n=1 Tax=Acinetobacter sp. XS-4 TaxID=2923375 RepID=UPI00208E0F79|nr:hypothetical protein [Acinetobacter sp. XS-4]USP40724.1 hypothetical protein MMY79_01120 [Acinetobacter sp. XS-4]
MQKKDILKAIALGAAMAASAQGANAATSVNVTNADVSNKKSEASTLIESMSESGIPILASRPECNIIKMDKA